MAPQAPATRFAALASPRQTRAAQPAVQIKSLSVSEACLPGWLVGVVQQCVKVDAQEQAALAREFEVFHLPALHLYLEGRYHAPILCQLTAVAVRAAVEQAVVDPAVEAP